MFIYLFIFYVLELVELFRLYIGASLCIYIFFFALDVFFDRGRYIVFIYMFLVSLQDFCRFPPNFLQGFPSTRQVRLFCPFFFIYFMFSCIKSCFLGKFQTS